MVLRHALLNVHFIRLAVFDRTAKGILTDDEEREMEQSIADSPKSSPVIANAGGVRKIRVSTKGRGKSGSVRVLYLYVQKTETVYLMVAYEKSVKDSISAAEKRQLKALAARLKEE